MGTSSVFRHRYHQKKVNVSVLEKKKKKKGETWRKDKTTHLFLTCNLQETSRRWLQPLTAGGEGGYQGNKDLELNMPVTVSEEHLLVWGKPRPKYAQVLRRRSPMDDAAGHDRRSPSCCNRIIEDVLVCCRERVRCLRRRSAQRLSAEPRCVVVLTRRA